MSSFTINVPASEYTVPSKARVEQARTGLYCEICREEPTDECPPYAHKATDGTWHVPAKGGGFYLVSQSKHGAWQCDCEGFSWRGRCRHLYGKDYQAGVIALEAVSRTHGLSHRQWIRYERRRWPADVHVDAL